MRGKYSLILANVFTPCKKRYPITSGDPKPFWKRRRNMRTYTSLMAKIGSIHAYYVWPKARMDSAHTIVTNLGQDYLFLFFIFYFFFWSRITIVKLCTCFVLSMLGRLDLSRTENHRPGLFNNWARKVGWCMPIGLDLEPKSSPTKDGLGSSLSRVVPWALLTTLP